jgi:hypothetical protein
VAVFRKVYYQDAWGDTHIIEIGEKAIADYVNQGLTEEIAVFNASYFSILDDLGFKMMEDHAFAARFIADAKKVVSTTGSFGEGFGSPEGAARILANQAMYITFLDSLAAKLTGTHPQLQAFSDNESLKNEYVFIDCKLAINDIPCWKITRFEK